MITFWVYLLFLHWLADFVFQSHWMASNKSKKLSALTMHVGTYGAVLWVGLMFPITPLHLVDPDFIRFVTIFVLVNTVCHFVTDFFTSKWTAYLHRKGDTHNFFVVIGLDQLIHQVTFILTAYGVVYYELGKAFVGG